MRILKILLFFLIIISFLLIGFLVKEYTQKITNIYTLKANVTKVIDGDTIETSVGKIRLLGLNTPEKEEPFHDEAKAYLKQFIGKEVELIKGKKNKDKYGRLLRYVYFQKRFLNKEIIERGLANLYYYEEDIYIDELRKAEERARNFQLGIWKKSRRESCIKILDFVYIEKERCKNQEQLIIENNCDAFDVKLKDDANHIFKMKLNNGITTKNFSCIFNDNHDSLYIRDEEGLVLFYRY